MQGCHISITISRLRLHILGTKERIKETVETTTIQYSQASSVHGIQYIFEAGENLLISKVIWIIFVIAAAAVGISWSVEAYEDWQQNPGRQFNTHTTKNYFVIKQ